MGVVLVVEHIHQIAADDLDEIGLATGHVEDVFDGIGFAGEGEVFYRTNDQFTGFQVTDFERAHIDEVVAPPGR